MSPDLVGRCRSGDELAWRELVERYARHVAAIVRSFRLGDADAEDVFQDAFLRTWRRLDDIPGDDALRGWIGQVTRNLCVDRIRRLQREAPADIELIEAAEPGADEVAELELSLDVHDALMQVSDDCRTVLDAFFFRDLSYLQIAEEFGLAQGTIASRISRCLGKLRTLVPATVA
jgi:RNA polymerase sigma-70 factor (ECF subfamily)